MPYEVKYALSAILRYMVMCQISVFGVIWDNPGFDPFEQVYREYTVYMGIYKGF